MMKNFDIEDFIATYEVAEKKRRPYSSFTFDEKGKKRQEKYFAIMREWSNAVIEKYDVKAYLGEKYFADLQFLLNTDRRFDVFHVFIDETEECYLLKNKRTIKADIQNLKKHRIFKQNAFYVCIRFKTSIKDFYYPGNAFLSLNKNTTADGGIAMLLDILENPNDFFPHLQSHIESLIPADEFEPDSWEFGSKDFGLYWDISAKAFPKFIKTFKAWIRYEQLENEFLYYWVHENKTEHHWHFDLEKMIYFSDVKEFPSFLV